MSIALPRQVAVRDLAWVGGLVAFLLLRGLAALHLPVSGAELVHLSGAWQAVVGVEDARFVPTFFQALAALLLQVDASERLPRLVAFLATATVPLALRLLRPQLGRDGALAALWLLAIDPLSILLGATASAMAVDTAMATWVLWLLTRHTREGVALAIAGAAAAVSGPAVLFLVLAWLGLGRPLRGWRAPAALAGGFLAGAVLASAGFGFGPVAPVVPPFDLFAAGTEEVWSTATTGELLLLYSLPLVVAGAAACGVLLRGSDPSRRLLVAWAAFSAAWLAFSLPDHNPAALAGLTLPLALTAAVATPAALGPALRARWAEAWPALAGGAIALVLGWAILADWARVERTGDGFEQVRITVFLAVAAILIAVVWLRPRTRAALTIPVGLVGLSLLIPGAAGLVSGGASEPLASPLAAPAARDLRDLAVARREAGQGDVVVHPSLREAITWPFRDSGLVVASSTVPPGAGIVLWPAGEPAPDGFVLLAGGWSLTWTIRTPTADILDSLHWFLDRNTLASKRVQISVYTREQP